jgi:TonB family protein
MKTKNNPRFMANLKLFLVLPVILLVLIAFSSCAAKKKVATVHTEIAAPPPPLPPPPPPPLTPAPPQPSMAQYRINGNDTIYSFVDEMPQFPGGQDAFEKFKTENAKYPPEIKNLGIEGSVLVGFAIEKSGFVSGINIFRGVSPSLDAEVIRVIKSMPPWQPAKVKGKPVKLMYWTAFEFAITAHLTTVLKENPVAIAGNSATTDQEEPFVVVEEMPIFPGGDSTLLAYLSQNTKYPESAKSNNIQGRVIVRFCVTSKGDVDKISVLKGVSPELNDEAIRVVSTLPSFRPGKQCGKQVPVWYMVPINFALSKTSSDAAPQTPTPPFSSSYNEAPVFPGGEQAIYNFINSNIVYPILSKEKKIAGKVNLSFCINIDGSIGEVSVIKGADPSLDNEAVRVIKLLPAWKPGKLDGTPVKVCYSLPVTFSLK